MRVGVPSYFVVLLYEPCAVLFKENYIVLFMKGDSINRGALMLGEELHRLSVAPAGLVCYLYNPL